MPWFDIISLDEPLGDLLRGTMVHASYVEGSAL